LWTKWVTQFSYDAAPKKRHRDEVVRRNRAAYGRERGRLMQRCADHLDSLQDDAAAPRKSA